MYMAGALHDVGKLAIHNNILEKPGKLDDKEYKRMQSHAWYTYDILNGIQGMQKITSWASYHHEKLNGMGYPFGKTAEELGREERMMACLDIYQALTEPRPYKDGMSHDKVMEIMNNMVDKRELDPQITRDIDRLFGTERKSDGQSQ